MRIGVDLFALQAPSCRGRGIGRYAKSLLRALVDEAKDWAFVFYRRPDLELDWDGDSEVEWVDVGPDSKGAADGSLQEVVQSNPQRLDWLLILSPVVERRNFAIPEPIAGGPQLAAVFYDLIPLLFPKHYLVGNDEAKQYELDLRRLQSYDLLAAISEATGRDLQKHLSIPSRRIANIRGAVDPRFFHPSHNDEDDARILAVHGIREPFFYYLGNVDWRKNVLGLVDAYALLPDEIKASHQLVLTFSENAWFRSVLKEKVDEHKLGDRVISTEPANDSAVRAFYRRAALFLSPSLYEGFGLPILEAMQCGAAVIAADNSSQPEVVGTAGVLARSGDADHWASTITDLVRDPTRVAHLRAASVIQAAEFSWQDSAHRLKSALESATRRTSSQDSSKLAIIPVPSENPAGFGPIATRVFEQLSRAKNSIVFFESGRATELPPLPLSRGLYEKSLLDRVLPVLGFPRLLYVVDMLKDVDLFVRELHAHPGVVALCSPDFIPSKAALDRIAHFAASIACFSDVIHKQILAVISEEIPGKIMRADLNDLGALQRMVWSGNTEAI